MFERRELASELAMEVKFRVDEKLGEIWWSLLTRGVLAVILGLCALAWPQQTVGVLIKVLGVYFLIDGVIGAVWFYRSGELRSALIQAIVGLTIGLILLVWTGVSAKIFMIFIGVWLILQGIGLFLSSRRIDSQSGVRGIMACTGGGMALIGIVFVVWPDTGVVTISWLIGLSAMALGCLSIFLATRIKRLRSRIDQMGEV
ncbi:MAG: DUF308 domain-containing protein [Pirellula sp.]|jgi:uncharacterized membrane protein HdeD (DUF308 family)|nr:DUF308 domain-containing protein [Pirellula sp.]